VVTDGDHSLVVGKKNLAASGRTQEEVDAEVLTAIHVFVASL
jgi:hypothetical protein